MLNEKGVVMTNHAGKPMRVPSDLKRKVDSLSYEVHPDFPDIPARPWGSKNWSHVRSYAWGFVEDIAMLEGRALFAAAERAANSVPCSGMRCLILSDNMSVVLAFNRSRSKDFPLRCLIRRLASLALARGIKFSLRWEPSGHRKSGQER